jgi:hypothetical protein
MASMTHEPDSADFRHPENPGWQEMPEGIDAAPQWAFWTGTYEATSPAREHATAELRRGLAFRKGFSARTLMAMRFDPIAWIVPGYRFEGMTVLAGASKLGKS